MEKVLKEHKFLSLDHLVIGVSDLEFAKKYFKENFDTQLEQGGRHEGKGTHNLLLNVKLDIEGYEDPENLVYLELIAKDNEQKIKPQWLGVGNITGKNQIEGITYAIRYDMSNSKDGQILTENLQGVENSSRKKADGSILKWKICKLKENDKSQFPFCLDWMDSIHPSKGMNSSIILKKIILEVQSQQQKENLIKQYQDFNIDQRLVDIVICNNTNSIKPIQFVLQSVKNGKIVTI